MTRSRLLYGLCFVCFAALGVFYEDHSIGFTVLYAMGLLFVIALVTILIAPSVIRVKEKADVSAVFKGEAVPYRLSVENRSPFLYPIRDVVLHNGELAAEGYEALSSLGAILPLRRGEREATLRFPYRGDYKLGVESLVVTDFLGLFSRAVKSLAPVSVLVYPSVDESFRVSVAEETESIARPHGIWSEDYSTVADVQKYTSSDSLRKIHWQLSASRGELLVKNFASHEQDRVVLFLDTSRLPLEGIEKAAFEDRMTSCVAAAVSCCVEARLPVALDFGVRDGKDKAKPKRKRFRKRKTPLSLQPKSIAPSSFQLLTGQELTSAYGLLAAVPFDRENPTVPRSDGISGASDVLLFLHSLNEQAYDAVAGLVTAGHRVTLYRFVSPPLPVSEEERRRLAALSGYGVKVHVVDAEEGGELL